MKPSYKSILIAVLLISFSPLSVSAKIQLPYFFSDGMVLQQQTSASIWGWADAGATIKITASWDKKTYTSKADSKGKWMLKLATPVAGGPYSISISDGEMITIKDVLIGEVWLCSGQSNMEMPMKGFRDQPILHSNDDIFNSANNNIRLYTVPRSVKVMAMDTSKKSDWKIANAETVNNFSASAYYFGRLVQKQLNVPVGLIVISYGGSSAEAWMKGDALTEYKDLVIPTIADTAKVNNRTPTTLYNGMMHPFIGFTFKGCLWYQGESNNGRADQYEKLFPAMVKQWRSEMGNGDFPFYFAQIAPYNYSQLNNAAAVLDRKNNSAYLRDAQRKAANTIPNSGMVVLMDNGEEYNIHPADKETVGKRFAYLALGHTYQFKGFAFQSPAYDSLLIAGNVATIKFKNIPNGITSFGKPLTQFEIAGSDKVFRTATANIRNGTVVVSSPLVTAPVAVRYAFKDFIIGELFSTEGYPISSFRTDDW